MRSGVEYRAYDTMFSPCTVGLEASVGDGSGYRILFLLAHTE